MLSREFKSSIYAIAFLIVFKNICDVHTLDSIYEFTYTPNRSKENND